LQNLDRATLNLITSAYESAHHRAFLSGGRAVGEQNGWTPHVMRLNPGQQDAAVRSIAGPGFSIIMLDEVPEGSSLEHAIRSARGRVVSLEPDLSGLGIPYVKCDPKRSVEIAIRLLVDAGHREIAIVSQFPSDPADESHAVGWQKAFMTLYRSLDYPLQLVRVHTPLMYSPTQQAYEELMAFLPAHPEITGIISKGDELTVGILAACRDSGRPVPEAISVVNVGDSPLMKFGVPAVTCVDYNVQEQVRVAAEILRAMATNSDSGVLSETTPCHLVQRGSVAPPPVLETPHRFAAVGDESPISNIPRISTRRSPHALTQKS